MTPAGKELKSQWQAFKHYLNENMFMREDAKPSFDMNQLMKYIPVLSLNKEVMELLPQYIPERALDSYAGWFAASENPMNLKHAMFIFPGFLGHYGMIMAGVGIAPGGAAGGIGGAGDGIGGDGGGAGGDGGGGAG